MPPEKWKTISSRPIYANNWMRLREDIARLPNGKETIYGVVDVNPAVGVLPFADPNHVVLVRQYRYVFDENHRWEMPTGGVRPGEVLETAAQRELQEEFGFRAADLEALSTFYSSKSIMHEIAHLFLARGLITCQAEADETEDLEVRTFSFEAALQMTASGEIRDAMTMIAILFAAQARR